MKDCLSLPTLVVAEIHPDKQQVWSGSKGATPLRLISADIRALLQTRLDAVIMPGWAVYERLGGKPQIGKCSILKNERQMLGRSTWVITTPTFAASREDAIKFHVSEAPNDPRLENSETFSKILSAIVEHNDRFTGAIQEVGFEPTFLNFSSVVETYKQEVAGVLDAWKVKTVRV